MTPISSLDPRLRVRDSSAASIWGWDMASVAARVPRRDLAPDWRDALREAVRRFAVRAWGGLLIAAGVAGALALGSHHATAPSRSTAGGRPPAHWLGPGGS